VLQDLVGLAANIEAAAGSLDSDPAAAAVILGDVQREARRALTELRELAHRIFPALLESGGLVTELRVAASRAGVPVRLAVDRPGPVSAALAGAVYACALDMFERVPAGTPVAVNVRSEPEGLRFEVVAECDLGAERRAPHDRVEALGGRVTITSGADRTTLIGSLPLAQ
jgi:signal transduction histidine kinase